MLMMRYPTPTYTMNCLSQETPKILEFIVNLSASEGFWEQNENPGTATPSRFCSTILTIAVTPIFSRFWRTVNVLTTWCSQSLIGHTRLCGLSAVNRKNQVNGSYAESLSFCLWRWNHEVKWHCDILHLNTFINERDTCHYHSLDMTMWCHWNPLNS